MRLLFLGLNYAPEEIGIGPYSAGLLESWVAAGHEADAVVAKPYYPQWRVFDGYRGGGWRRSVEHGVRLVRCPLYVPRRPTGLRRILHHLSFAATSLMPMLRRARRGRPELVMTVAPSLMAAPVALLAARLVGAKTWLHVQDFELEAAQATGLVGKGAFARLAAAFERRVLRAFDRVSAISPQMCAKLAAKGVPPERIVEFRNWAEIDAIRPLDAPSPYRSEWSIAAPHVALYAGNIANKQGIGIVLEAARLLAHRTDLAFVICGEGPNRVELERQAADLPNVTLHGLQPRERLGELLGLATVHLLPQLADAADLVLPSKLANMVASGRPVVATAAPGTGIADELDGCGIATAPGDAWKFAVAIETLLDDEGRRIALGRAARERAEQRWSRAAILQGFIAEASVM
jgi:colanic acid biosynthesis glycosyl transferase WcaI